VFDIAGDMTMGIIYTDFDNTRKVAHFFQNQSKFVNTLFSAFVVPDGTDKCLPLSSIQGKTIKVPNSNAFVDFNGDCKADMFFESVDTSGNLYYEFWSKYKEGKYCLV